MPRIFGLFVTKLAIGLLYRQGRTNAYNCLESADVAVVFHSLFNLSAVLVDLNRFHIGATAWLKYMRK